MIEVGQRYWEPYLRVKLEKMKQSDETKTCPLLDQFNQVVATDLAQMGLILEGVKALKAGKHSRLVCVIDLADGPGNLTQDQLSAATHIISAAADQIDPISGPYQLEVTTPGIERPLSTPRHFRRALGREISVQLDQEQTLVGKLVQVSAQGIELQVKADSFSLSFDQITRAQMVIRF